MSGSVGDSSDAPTLSFTISVVIPTKNEARNIGWVLERIGPIVDEIVIVDGLSNDGTVEAAIEVRPDSVILRHPVGGKGEAVRAGFASATGDFVVMLDADGSMHPGEIPGFVEELARGSDFVKGSRFLKGGGTSDMTLLRRFGNAVLVRLANLLLGTSHTDLCYGYMAFRRSRLEDLDLRASGFEIETELVVKACRAGLTVTEIPSHESPRRYGTSNLNTFRDGWRVLRTLVRERFAARVEIPSSETTLGERFPRPIPAGPDASTDRVRRPGVAVMAPAGERGPSDWSVRGPMPVSGEGRADAVPVERWLAHELELRYLEEPVRQQLAGVGDERTND